VLFDTIHRVTGVASVMSATGFWLPTDTDGPLFFDFKDSSTLGICPGAGAFLDFSSENAVAVHGTTSTTPVAAQEGV
jgi:hypothetical protein